MIRSLSPITGFLRRRSAATSSIKRQMGQNSKPLTYAFDLDGTLCTLTNGNYQDAKPLRDRISHVNALKAAGHTIIIFTARGTTSGKDLTVLTTDQLNSWGLKFDQLLFGKPHFDLLVDDKAMSESEYFSIRRGVL